MEFCLSFNCNVYSFRFIYKGYKYNGNPIFANYNFAFWILAIIFLILTYITYRREND